MLLPLFSLFNKNIFLLVLGIILIALMAYVFYEKEMEVRNTGENGSLNCSKFHHGTYVYYFNASKPNKRIIIDEDRHIEFESDSNWIESKIHRFTDCHYRLEVSQMNSRDTNRQIGDFIEVKIDKTEQDTMFYRVNRSGLINKGRLVKVSNQGVGNLPLTKTFSTLSSPK